MKERVLIITEAYKPNVGGVETHVDDLMRYLRKMGHRATIITYQPLTTKMKGAKVEKEENLEIHRLSWFGNNLRNRLETYPPLIFLYIFPWLFLYSFFFMLRRHKEIDAIHAHGLIPAVIAVILAKLFGKKSILTTHTIFRLDEHWFLRTVLKPVLSRIDMNLMIAPGAKLELMNIGIPEDRVKVFTHWIDLDVFKPLDKKECRQKLGLDDKFIFLFVGRFHEQKNVRLLLKAASMIDNKDITFVFVGNGALEENIRQAQKQNGNIILLGPMDNRKLPVAYSAADVFWGDIDVDYLSRVTIESFACGTPTISPSCLQILNVTKDVTQSMFSEAISAGILKFVDPAPETLVKVITAFYYQRQETPLLSQHCREYALKYHSDKNAEIIRNEYRRENNRK